MCIGQYWTYACGHKKYEADIMCEEFAGQRRCRESTERYHGILQICLSSVSSELQAEIVGGSRRMFSGVVITVLANGWDDSGFK